MIWAIVSVRYRNRAFDYESLLPEAFRDIESALALATVGGALLISGDILRRLRPQRRLANAPAQSLDRQMEANWDDPASRRKVMEFTRTQHHEEPRETQQTLGHKSRRPQKRIALRPCWPQRRTQSWVGGLPKLPPDYPWPAIDGKPAAFLAQIWLEDLPETLWQGLGPRKGWLAFFADPDRADHVAVRHVQAPVDALSQPAHTPNNWTHPDASKALRAAFGAEAHVPARWYLEPFEGKALGAVEDMEKNDPAHWDAGKGEYVWEPTWHDAEYDALEHIRKTEALRSGVDWPSQMALFTPFIDQLTKRQASLEEQKTKAQHDDQTAAQKAAAELLELKDIAEQDPDQQELYDKRRAEVKAEAEKRLERRNALSEEAKLLDETHQEVAALYVDLQKLSSNTPFDPRAGDALWGLATVIDTRFLARNSFSHAAQFKRNAAHMIECYARKLFADRGIEAVPAQLRSLFEGVWAHQCRETLIFIGLNHEGQSGPQPNARLIDLPTNPLTGQMFGDCSRFYVDLPAPALENGKFHRAISSDTHGVY